jgi:cobalamin biosynthesis Co2+ chelatase CbiK
MINQTLLYTKNSLNDFTKKLKQKIGNTNHTKFEKCVLVQMRNQQYIDVYFQPIENILHSKDFSHVWSLDGSSDTSEEFDLIYFKE